MRKRPSLHWLSLVIFIAAIQVAVADEVRVDNRDELVRALQQAEAGTTILIAPGTYRGGFSHAGLQGTQDQPIVIAGVDPINPPAIDAERIGLHLSSPAHVELRDLVILRAGGNGINIDDSGSALTPAHDLVLRNIVVRGTSPRGNRDGIKLSGIDTFRIEDCHVERWGSSGSAIDMVGCHKGIVRGCKFMNASGDSANGVQTKGGSSDIVIQHCRFENAGGRAVNVGGSTGLPYFRPSDAGFEAKNITVEDCEILGGMAAIAFVGVDGALVQHNTIYRPRRWPVRILQENTDPRFIACRNGRFVHNVIAFRSDEVREAINVGGNTETATFEFSGNAWHCLDRPQDTQRLVRTPVKETKSSYGPDPGFKDAENGNLEIPNRQPEYPGARPRQSLQP